MKQGFSLGMDVTINEDGKYDASISYLDTEDNEIAANAQGKNIEEVCWDLYNKLSEQITAIEEEEEKQDMTDEEYIIYLEDYVAELKAENAALRNAKEAKKEEKAKTKNKNFSEEEFIKQINKILDENKKINNTFKKKYPYLF